MPYPHPRPGSTGAYLFSANKKDARVKPAHDEFVSAPRSGKRRTSVRRTQFAAAMAADRSLYSSQSVPQLFAMALSSFIARSTRPAAM